MTSEATFGQIPDVYGQVHPVETPELIERKRKEFEFELSRLPEDSKINLRRAEKICPQLLTDDFKLMFLRCEVFNADLAAARYAQYWDKRVELVGAERAFKPLTLEADGALSDDRVALEQGAFCMTGTHDAFGHQIFYVNPALQDRTKYTRESMLRAVWYILHAALEDESTQKRGIICLVHVNNAKLSQFDRKLTKFIFDSVKGAIPLRLSALHLCKPPSFMGVVMPVLKVFMGPRLKKRIFVHAAKKDEKFLNSFAKFKLSKDALPTDLGGNTSIDVIGWLDARRVDGR